MAASSQSCVYRCRLERICTLGPVQSCEEIGELILTETWAENGLADFAVTLIAGRGCTPVHGEIQAFPLDEMHRFHLAHAALDLLAPLERHLQKEKTP